CDSPVGVAQKSFIVVIGILIITGNSPVIVDRKRYCLRGVEHIERDNAAVRISDESMIRIAVPIAGDRARVVYADRNCACRAWDIEGCQRALGISQKSMAIDIGARMVEAGNRPRGINYRGLGFIRV